MSFQEEHSVKFYLDEHKILNDTTVQLEPEFYDIDFTLRPLSF